MAGEFAHITVGTELTQAEYEALTGHKFDGQATGDMMYAVSAAQLSKLGIGAANAVLHVAGGIPVWSLTLSGLTLTSINPVLLGDQMAAANFLAIPTTAGWAEVLVGSGVAYQLPTSQGLDTGAVNNSSALCHTNLLGFCIAQVDWGGFDWDEKAIFVFNYAPSGNVATAVRRVQFKSVNAIGALGAKGLGIRVDNLDLFGESYGTALDSVDLGVALTGSNVRQIVIVHDPTIPEINWYVDGVLKGTQATANRIPSGVSTGSYMVHSLVKGAVVDLAFSWVYQPRVWQTLP